MHKKRQDSKKHEKSWWMWSRNAEVNEQTGLFEKLKLKFGVPPGSVHGPVMFWWIQGVADPKIQRGNSIIFILLFLKGLNIILPQ